MYFTVLYKCELTTELGSAILNYYVETNTIEELHSDEERRFMYQNRPSKSHQLPFDQGVSSVVYVPEPIGALSEGILYC